MPWTTLRPVSKIRLRQALAKYQGRPRVLRPPQIFARRFSGKLCISIVGRVDRLGKRGTRQMNRQTLIALGVAVILGIDRRFPCKCLSDRTGTTIGRRASGRGPGRGRLDAVQLRRRHHSGQSQIRQLSDRPACRPVCTGRWRSFCRRASAASRCAPILPNQPLLAADLSGSGTKCLDRRAAARRHARLDRADQRHLRRRRLHQGQRHRRRARHPPGDRPGWRRRATSRSPTCCFRTSA